MCEGMNVYWTC